MISVSALHARAALYHKIRTFFAERTVLEVETPLLCQHTVTDPHIHSYSVPTAQKEYYLQTSPEYAMKRLLANGSGSIYQITKAFRYGDVGRQHNPEFTMLEFYRIGFDHHELMAELDALLQYCLNTPCATKMTYQQLFLEKLAVDPLTITLDALKTLIKKNEIVVDVSDIDHDTALQLLLSHLIEPTLGIACPLFLYDFPPSQAALSKIENGVAHRFELYMNGSEIANGFHELTNVDEQKLRFEKNQQKRGERGQFIPDIDIYFLDALKKGLPECAGVAVGLDRLLMQALQTKNIEDVVAFPFACA